MMANTGSVAWRSATPTPRSRSTFFGVLNVSKAALPHLRATKGRLLTVTSVGGVVGQPFNEAEDPVRWHRCSPISP